MLSRFIIDFLPGKKCLLIRDYSDFGAPKIKSLTLSIVSPSIWHEVIIATGKHRFGVLDFVFIEI